MHNMKILPRIIGIVLASVLFINPLSAVAAYPNRSWDVANVPATRLKVRISATQTTSIQLNAPSRNGVTLTWPTTTGGVLYLKQGTREEHIYYETATVNATTKVVTLTGTVTRGLCWNQSTGFSGCSDGQIFTPGAAVIYANDSRLYNLKANIDRVNVFTGSGQISSNQTNQAVLRLNSVTTTQRNVFTRVGDGDQIYNSTVGAAQYRAGGAWYSFGSGAALVNATLTVAGRGQVASTGAILARTATGSTGGENFLSARYTTASGGLSGVRKAGYVMVTDKTGFGSGTLLGKGPTSTRFLRGDQTWGTPLVQSGVNLYSSQTVSTAITGLSSTTFAAIDGTNLNRSIPVSVGQTMMITFIGNMSRSAGDPVNGYVDVQVGNNPLGRNNNGLVQIGTDAAATNSKRNASFIIFHRIMTGGTLTFQPLYKVDSNSIRFNGDTTFQVIQVQ